MERRWREGLDKGRTEIVHWHFEALKEEIKKKKQGKPTLLISEEENNWAKETTNFYNYNGEFDPGSGWTLAGGLTHASRAGLAAMLWERRTGA
jgi:hypothetical protein